MKKKRIFLTTAILLLCLALLCGCQRRPKMTVGAQSDLNVRNDMGITLTATTPATASGGKFTLANNSDSYYHHGSGYYIEKRVDDGWYQLKGEGVFTLLLYTLNIGDTYMIDSSWDSIYGKLSAGEYRIVQEILPPDYPENKDSFFVSCEFTIE